MTIMETKPVNDHNELERDLVVTDAVAIATDVVMLRLADASGADLPEWAPGAHIDVTLDGNIRQYSLCGDPNERKSWRIAVLREEAGRGGSKLLHERARHGLQLTARGPRNHFTLRPATEYLFVAGGIGITPLLPMVAAAEAAGTPWRLVYGARSADRLSFVPELEQYGSKVTFQPEDTHGMLDLKQLVVELPQGTETYACGPTGLLDRLEELCAEAGKPLHIERFSADPKALAGASGTSSFEVIAETSGVTVTVPPGTSIVRALEDAGVDVLTSCEEGVCSTCETRVLAGIPEHHDSVLNDDERERNDIMMICVSRAKTPSLTLDI